LAAGDVHASTIALNWMIEHHIISTISGHDHRSAWPLRYARHWER